MKTQVKLCGFRTLADVEKVQGIPVTAMGFILVPNRKRTVRREDLPDLLKPIPPDVMTVGVLQNPAIEEIKEWLTIAPLKAIQLHGEEPPSFCQRVKENFTVTLVKTFHMDEQNETPLNVKVYAPFIDIALLDSSVGNVKGGTGVTFCWEAIPPFQQECQKYGIPVWVAGGLHEANIASLIGQYRPDGVDVSSGIETDGRKDRDKMVRFVERVKSVEQAFGSVR